MAGVSTTRIGSSIHTYIKDGTKELVYISGDVVRKSRVGDLATIFTHTFEFVSDHPIIDVALQIMKEKIFE